MATVLGALPDDTSWEDTFDEATSVLSISVEAPVEVSPIEHLQVTADDDLDDAEDGGFSRSSDSDSVSGEVICRLPAGTPEAPHVALQKVILAPWIGAWSALLATPGRLWQRSIAFVSAVARQLLRVVRRVVPRVGFGQRAMLATRVINAADHDQLIIVWRDLAAALDQLEADAKEVDRDLLQLVCDQQGKMVALVRPAAAPRRASWRAE